MIELLFILIIILTQFEKRKSDNEIETLKNMVSSIAKRQCRIKRMIKDMQD